MLKVILDIIYPRCCICCKKSLHDAQSERLICADCLEGIQMNHPPFCKKCGRHLDYDGGNADSTLCHECQNKNLFFDRGWSACSYNDKMKELLHLFKYKNKTALRKPLAELIVNFTRDFNIPTEEFDCIIPMPLHPTRLREREYNQTELLAREISQFLSLSVQDKTVQRIRNTKPQSSLGASQRWANIKGAFKIKNPQHIEGKNILVIDDLYTTGATVSEVALALKDSGAKTVNVLTLAIAQ